MKPTTTVAEARTPDGAKLFLQHHDGHYSMRVDGELLMSTRAWRSEAEMAELGCAPVAGREPRRVLIGGLGFGFTLRRVLELVGPTAEVEVAELLPVLVDWNRRLLREVNGGLLDDPRVKVTVDDVFAVLRAASPARYDVALLDVDNGPVALVDRGNRRLYADDGLRILSRALAPGGRAVFWSGAPDRGFLRRLFHAGFRARAVGAKAYPKAVRATHTLFVADRDRGPADAPRPGGGAEAPRA
jgi:spermidine synthase